MAKQPPFRLILASASPARRDLLTRGGYEFEVVPSHVEEPTGPISGGPRSFVQHTAWLKAQAVADRIRLLPPNAKDREQTVVLAADTVGWLDGKVIGKPADEDDARRILRLLGGTRHELWTGVCLWRCPDQWQLAWQEMSLVAFKPLSETELDTYLATRLWRGCSGAYAIQEKDDPFVQLISGSMTNVIGLPMESLAKALRWLSR